MSTSLLPPFGISVGYYFRRGGPRIWECRSSQTGHNDPKNLWINGKTLFGHLGIMSAGKNCRELVSPGRVTSCGEFDVTWGYFLFSI